MESYSTEKSIPKRKIGECSYHLCDKKQVELFKCDHCKDYFCKEHFDARIPMLAPFKSTDIDIQLEWEKKGGHPCIPYVYYAVKKEEELKIEREHIYYGKKLHVDILEPEPEIKTKLPEIPDSTVKETPNNTNFGIPKKQITATEKDSHEEIAKKIDSLFEEPVKKESKVEKYEPGSIEPESEEKQIEENIIKYIEKKQGDSNQPILPKSENPEASQKILEPVVSTENNAEEKTVSASSEYLIPKNNISFVNRGLILKIIGVFLVILLLFSLWLLYTHVIEINNRYSELSEANENLDEITNQLDFVNGEISSTEASLQTMYSNVQLLKSGNKYDLHDPTYSEVIDFLNKDKTNSNTYNPSSYTCAYFSKDVNNNAESKGVRCAYVELSYPSIGHAIVAFETTDKGLVYFEPQHDVRASVEVGKKFYSCLAQLPGYLPWEAPDYDDTIQEIKRFW